jgi:hypothetical protein
MAPHEHCSADIHDRDNEQAQPTATSGAKIHILFRFLNFSRNRNAATACWEEDIEVNLHRCIFHVRALEEGGEEPA